jgi:hypothetical protein
MALAVAALAVWLGAGWWGTDRHARQAALDFVRLHGSTSEATAPGPFAQTLSRLLGRQVRAFSAQRTTVSFPPEQLTDNMLDHLLAIDDLHAVLVFDRGVPQGTKLYPSSIEHVAPHLSPAAMARFRDRFPHAKVWAVTRPPP